VFIVRGGSDYFKFDIMEGNLELWAQISM